MTWIVIGSSPLAPQSYQLARSEYPSATTITANRGIFVEPCPDFYCLIDMVACPMFADYAKAAAREGTICVTLKRNPRAMADRKVDWFHLQLRQNLGMEPFQLSGTFCLEFAARIGKARRIVLCGMDGYDPQIGAADHFENPCPVVTNDAGRKKGHSQDVIQPSTQRVCEKYPDVEFICIGQPRYQVESENWRVRLL